MEVLSMNNKELSYYKTLNYKVEAYLDPKEERWFASIPDLGDVLSDGATAEEAVRKVLTLKDEVIEADYKRGLKIPEPREEIEYSGKFLLRVPRSLHKDLAEEAEREGTSINRFVIQVLSGALEHRKTLSTVTESIKSTLHDSVKATIIACLEGLPTGAGARQEIGTAQESEVVYRQHLNRFSFNRDAVIAYRTALEHAPNRKTRG
jgi:predicted HicB family RNase H-like nuclease